jgi:serine/threonine protein kinase/tetratricopeptide (TPR) repeat protein
MTTEVQVLGEVLADRYLVERELGRGGTATVYLAHDRKHNRRVAIKILKPELAAVLGSDRFLREIEIAAQLNHPHVLPLHDSGQSHGLLYYVMPYVEGESLRDLLNRGRLPIADVLRLTREIADGLGYAHRLGIVHRDVKPENILLSEGHAVVADFGIAQALTVAGANRLTEFGLAVGTPVYMSPEQARGMPDLDARSDIYSLACVVYEMLAGEPPVTGLNLEAVLARKASGHIPSLHLIQGRGRPAMEAALTRALAPQPADRFDTVGEFAESFARGGEPARRLSRRQIVVIATMIAVGGILIRFLPSWLGDRPAVTRSPAAGIRIGVLPPESLSDSQPVRPESRLIQYLLSAELTRHRGLAVIDPMSLNSRLLPAGEQRVTDPIGQLKDWGVEYVVRITLNSVARGTEVSYALTSTDQGAVKVTGAFTSNGEPEIPGQLRLVADRVREALDLESGGITKGLDLEPFLARAPDVGAVNAFLQGAEYAYRGLPGGRPHFERAIELDPDFIAPRVWLVSGLLTARDTAAARTQLNRLRALQEKATPFDQALIGWADARTRGDPEAAVRHLRVALGFSPRNNILLWNLGLSLLEMGRPEEAVVPVQEALESGWNYPSLYTLWGILAIQTGRFEGLHQLLEKGRAIPPSDPYLSGLLEALALFDGDTAATLRYGAAFRKEAGAELARALAEMTSIYLALAGHARESNRPERAAALLERAVRAQPDRPDFRLELARALIESGNRELAEDHYEAAARADTSRSNRAAALFGEVALLLDRRGEAREWFERYLRMYPDGPGATTARNRLQELSRPAGTP